MGHSQIKAFKTVTGIEVGAITTDQMREVDRIAMEETGPNLFQMMENAGRNLALQAIEILGHGWQKANIVVLAGLGGNAGGGICGARHLANRQANVQLALSNPDNLGDVPALQRKIFHSTSGKEVETSELINQNPDLILDAVIGYSLKGAPRGAALEFIHWANTTGAPILSLDVPSGVDSTTGDSEGEYMHAKWTMTLALPKTGLLPAKTGELYLADIGIPEGVYSKMGLEYNHPFENHYRIHLSPASNL
jgi:NAD(P)H-hydrate epimerase